MTVGLSIAWLLCCCAPLATMAGQNQGDASVAGYIYDNRFGLPIPGAKVTLRFEGGHAISKTSGGDGRYKFSGLPGGRYKLSAETLGFALTERMVDLRASEEISLDLPLRIGRLHDPIPIGITGLAMLSDKTPLPGVSILLISPFDQEIVGKTLTTRSGQYTLKVDEPGQYVLYAVKFGFGVKAISIIVRPTLPRETLRADITLNPLHLR
jgi:hypothetical protein